MNSWSCRIHRWFYLKKTPKQQQVGGLKIWKQSCLICKAHLRPYRPTQGLPKVTNGPVHWHPGWSCLPKKWVQHSRCRAIWEQSSALHYFIFLCEQGVCHYESCFEWLFQALPYSSKMILVTWLLAMGNWERKGKKAVEGWLRRECKRHESVNKICFGIIQKVHYKHQKGVLICCFILL